MSDSTPKPLRFPTLGGHTVRADFNGGALSTDFGPLLLRGVDQQIGLMSRLSAAIHDQRHLSLPKTPSVNRILLYITNI